MKSRLLVDAIVFIILIVMLISCGGPSAEPVKSGTSRIAHAFILDGNFEICVINPGGSNFQNLTNNTGWDCEPTWSPDGSKIAFLSTRDGNGEIYAMDADGFNKFNLSNNMAEEQHPSWAPNGSKITFASVRDGNWEIYIMDADGSNQIRLTNDSADDRHALWSSDGLFIAFVSQHDLSNRAQMQLGQNEYLYMINADGSN